MSEAAMTPQAMFNDDDQFKKYLGLSALAHALIVTSFAIKVVFFPESAIVDQPALRVDLVSLPDKISEPAERPVKAPPEPEAKPQVATPPPPPPPEKAVNLNPKQVKLDAKKKQQESLNKVKQLSALEEIERQEKQERTAKTVYKGNQISKGSELRGLSVLEHDSYISDVQKHIRRFWAIPQWLSNKNLKTRVRVKFDEGGNITNKEILQSSGNLAFDEATMSTLEKASPVPKPPDKFQKLVNYEGILIGFPE